MWVECTRPSCVAARRAGALTLCLECTGTGWVRRAQQAAPQAVEDGGTAPTVVMAFETMAEMVHGKGN